MKSWSWVLLIVLTILIKWVSWYPDWVEKNYTYGIYPVISKIQRFLFGWIPFSIGDLFYGFLILVVILPDLSVFSNLLFQKKLTRSILLPACNRPFSFFFLYMFFSIFFGD